MTTTRQDLFDKRSLRRWYAIGTVFWPPYRVPLSDGKECLGCQVMAMQDVESQCFIGQRIAPRAPAPFVADEILSFADEMFTKHGRPKKGLLILPSTWRSTDALHEDEVTRERVAGVRKLGMSWDEMSEAERLRISLRIQSLGLALEWKEDAIPDLEALLNS